VNKGIPPEKESRAEGQDANEANLENHHSPPHCRCHVNHLFENCFDTILARPDVRD